MAARTGNSSETMSEINMTPLVDIMLVLLIIFMLTSTTIQAVERPNTVDLDLPTAASAEQRPSQPLNIVIDQRGQTWLDGQEVDGAALSERARARLAADTAGGQR